MVTKTKIIYDPFEKPDKWALIGKVKPYPVAPIIPPDKADGASPKILKETAPRNINYSISAEGALIPIAYGRCSPPGRIFAVTTDGSYLIMGIAWAAGECAAINNVYADKTAIASANVHNYLGTPTGAVDSWLSANISGYGDTLPNICYSVVRINAATYSSPPKIWVDLNALKVYDPRTTSTGFSENFALHYRDAAVRMGFSVDDASIEDTADRCDTEIGTTLTKRRAGGFFFDYAVRAEDALLTLAEYAGGFHYIEGNTCYLIPDAPASVTTSFTWDETDGTAIKIREGSFVLKKRSMNQSPNHVIVEYTDLTTKPWRRAFAQGSLPSGTLRSTRIAMSGFHNYNTAHRYRIEKQNYYDLIDLEVEFVCFDDGLEMAVGDVFDIDSPDLTAKQFRCLSMSPAENGQWNIFGREYDPAKYSDADEDEPTFDDTTLPNPSIVPDAPVPSLSEENYQLQNETWATRIHAEWAAVTDYPYNHEFEMRAYVGTALIGTVRTDDLEATFGPLQEAVQYDIDLYVVGVGGIRGAKGSNSLTALGKQNPPEFGVGAQLRGVEAGGRVFLNWDAADDDIWAYEVRFGGSGQTWAQMSTLTQTDTLWYTAETVPQGTWDFKVRAIDSVGVESTNELTLSSLEVTSDADSYAAVDATIAVDTGNLTNMTLSGVEYLPDDGTSWNTLFPNAMNTYTNPLITYGGSFTTQVWSQEHDIGAIVSANFQMSTNVQEYVGTVDYTLQISDTSGGPYDDYSVLSVNASGRYVRLKVIGLTTDRWVLRPEYFHITALVNTITKEGEGTSSSSTYVKITLDRAYSKVVSLKIQPVSSGGAEDLTGVPDDIILNDAGYTTFKVYVFKDGVGQVERDFYYTARVIK